MGADPWPQVCAGLFRGADEGIVKDPETAMAAQERHAAGRRDTLGPRYTVLLTAGGRDAPLLLPPSVHIYRPRRG